jgi:hypothetical protein
MLNSFKELIKDWRAATRVALQETRLLLSALGSKSPRSGGGRLTVQAKKDIKKLVKLAFIYSAEGTEYENHLFTAHFNKVVDDTPVTDYVIDVDNKVIVNFSTVWGTASDYYNAVVLTRNKLGVDENGKIESRSNYWKHLYLYLDDMYETTIMSRLGFCGNKAPYWELLDVGTGMSGLGQGGTPFPTHGYTGFLQKVQDDINTYLFGDSLHNDDKSSGEGTITNELVDISREIMKGNSSRIRELFNDIRRKLGLL